MRFTPSKMFASIALLASMQGNSATFTVTSMADSGPGTLRDAIVRANSTVPSGHRIVFSRSGTVILSTELPNITTSLEIDGTGHFVTVSGDRRVPIMHNVSGYTVLRRITLAKAVRYAVRGSYFVDLIESTVDSVNGTGVHVSGGRASIVRSLFHNINGTAIQAARVEVSNSTFTRGNAVLDVPSFKYGAVIEAKPTASTGSISLTNVTISDSVLTTGTVVLRVGNWSESRRLLTNTVIANTTGGSNCDLPELPYYAAPDHYDGGGNYVSDTSCRPAVSTSVVGTAAMLGTLQDNGGPTLTMQPLTGSPAINGGVATSLTTDQRGFARVSGAAVDKGAVEVAGALGLRGFYFPIRNWPLLNVAAAGRLVPVRFGFNGYQGLGVIAQGYPQVATTSCTNSSLVPVAEYVASGAGTLTYDTQTQQYEYVLSSPATWAGTCRKVSFRFVDGSSIDAYFKFN